MGLTREIIRRYTSKANANESLGSAHLQRSRASNLISHANGNRNEQCTVMVRGNHLPSPFGKAFSENRDKGAATSQVARLTGGQLIAEVNPDVVDRHYKMHEKMRSANGVNKKADVMDVEDTDNNFRAPQKIRNLSARQSVLDMMKSLEVLHERQTRLTIPHIPRTSA